MPGKGKVAILLPLALHFSNTTRNRLPTSLETKIEFMSNQTDVRKIESAAIDGIDWLLNLQNWDGGMPTFCQGWGMLPFDKSSTDITAHAIRALQAWRKKLTHDKPWDYLHNKMQRAEERMFDFLRRTQQPNGSWHPLWFGSQFMPDSANPCYGTAKVLLALAETKRDDAMTYNGLRYLIASQNTDGGWGRDFTNRSSSVEETATVIEALSLFAERAEVAAAYHRGLTWLLEAVESDRFSEASPIGLYFASLWYYEDLYPIIFTASALRRALREASGVNIRSYQHSVPTPPVEQEQFCGRMKDC